MEGPVVGIPFMLLAGSVLAFLGFGPLSRRKHPTAGVGIAIAGFVTRLLALLILFLFVFLLIIAFSDPCRWRGGG